MRIMKIAVFATNIIYLVFSLGNAAETFWRYGSYPALLKWFTPVDYAMPIIGTSLAILTSLFLYHRLDRIEKDLRSRKQEG